MIIFKNNYLYELYFVSKVLLVEEFFFFFTAITAIGILFGQFLFVSDVKP